MKSLIFNPSYLLSVMSMTIMMLITMTLTFSSMEYMIVVFHSNPDASSLIVIITILTSPTLGMVIGAFIIDKYVGSYSKRGALVFVSLAYAVFTALVLSLPLTKD